MKQNWSLKNKKALVTGGSRGIGFAIAEDLLKAGAEVLITGRNKSDLESACNKLNSSPGKLKYKAMDVSSKESLESLYNFISSEWEKLDILINNVGTNLRKKAEEYLPEEIKMIFDTNLNSAFQLSVRLLPFLKQSTSGCIVNISSVAGLGHLKTGVIYGMTKAAMNQMTKNLAVEWAEHGIRVNAVAPWYTDTPLARQVLKDSEFKNAVLNRTPMKRIARPSEVSSLVRFLCLPAAGFITGQCIAVDGGFSINLFS